MRGKAKVSLVILETVIALGILAIPLVRFGRLARLIDFSTPAWAASTGKAMMSYYDVTTIPKYRIWDGSSWGSPQSAQDIGTGHDAWWHVLRSCPKRNEKILGTLDDLEDVYVQVWNGSSWSTPKKMNTAADTGTATKRAFDIAYAQFSGNALVVFSVNSATPQYYTWDGSSWATSAGNTATTGGNQAVQWVGLASKPNSNEIILVTQDKGYSTWAQVWDGSGWGNTLDLPYSTDVTTSEAIRAAYEQSSGRGLVVHLDNPGKIPRYSIWDGSSWSKEGEAAPRDGGIQRWVRLASKPASNQIIMGTVDTLDDVQCETWYSGDSEGWSNMNEIERASDDIRRRFDVAYENSSGRGMIVYWSPNNADRATYSVWTGSAWTSGGTTSAVADGATIYWITLASNPDTNEIMLMTIDSEADINVQKWSGSGWSAIEEVETTSYSGTSTTGVEPFAIDYDRHSQVSIIIQKWRELYH